MSLVFPKDLSDRYYLSITFRAYSRPNPLTNKISLEPSKLVDARTSKYGFGSSSRSGSDSIRLPLPATMVDSQSLNWSVESMSHVVEHLMASGDTNMIRDLGLVGMQKFFESSQGALGGLAGSASTAALQQAGLAMNPLLTVLFKHPEFRTHQFTWTFSPNSQQESITLKQIIETLRLASLPNNYGSYFGYPDMALIRYSNEDTLYKFQPSVITNVTSNYAPTGAPSFFEGDRAPNMVNLTISFLEVILNTRESYGSSNINNFFSLNSSSKTTQKANNQINNG